MVGLHQKLHTGGTSAANGNIVILDGELAQLTVYITTTDTTVSAGAVTCEEAPSGTYTGTWAAMSSDTGGSAAITPVAGTTIVRHYTGCFGAVRARISTSITGGAAVDVDIFGNLDT